jgi:pimeloyl-ACP methyl ester carboxylesterase
MQGVEGFPTVMPHCWGRTFTLDEGACRVSARASGERRRVLVLKTKRSQEAGGASGSGDAGAAPAQLLFLPGASGNTDFWRPVAALLRTPVAAVQHVGWPGFGPTPPVPGVTSVEHLVERVVGSIQRPTALIAQSMGGVVALLATLAKPELVTHLVIAALSAGVDMKRHGARDWRPPRDEISRSDPSHLFAAYDEDLSSRLSSIEVPTLLLWGDSDPVSPVSVGRWLATVLPRSALHVIQDGTHTFSNARAGEVAPLIDLHLSTKA